MLILAYSQVGDSLIRLGFRRRGRHEIPLEERDVWLEAYVIGLGRKHQSAEAGLTLWERLERDLVSLESSSVSVVLESPQGHTHVPISSPTGLLDSP